MADLTAKGPFDGLLPITLSDMTCEALHYGAITWVSPLRGKAEALSKALEQQIGAAMPAPGNITGNGAYRAVWTGPDQAFILGKALDPIDGAAMVDQTDAWACCALHGARASDVLARLVPVDLRETLFPIGHSARTLLGHMNCVLMRVEVQRFEIMVFRSMAQTAVHDLTRAMRMVAARDAAQMLTNS